MAKETVKKTIGSVKELEAALNSAEGSIEKLGASISASNLAVKALNEASRVFGSLPTQIIDFNEQLVKSSTLNEDFAKTINKTRNAIFELSERTSEFGIGTRENLKIVKELSKENVKLLPIYKKNIVGLTDFSARLKAFGVETKTSAGLIGTLTSNLDMTADQLDVTRRTLVSFAKQTGQSVQEVVKSYSSNIKSFMDFLDPAEMNKSFMQFQVMARRMGMEANQLYGIATKFDTIQGAQQMGARLNQTFSALGMEFNALALQEMEPRERMDYIAKKTREALSKARGMGGREGRLIMRSLQAAGLGDLQTIRALGAEGGGRGGALGAISPMGRGAEAGMAQRLNFERVTAARAEQLNIQLFKSTGAYEKLNPVLSKFAEGLLAADKALDPIKMAAAKGLGKAGAAAVGRAVDVATLNAKIGPEAARVLSEQGITASADSTLSEIIGTMAGKLKKMEQGTAARGMAAGAAIGAGAGAAGVGITDAQIKKLGMTITSALKTAFGTK
jgi:hypothetical protein